MQKGFFVEPNIFSKELCLEIIKIGTLYKNVKCLILNEKIKKACKKTINNLDYIDLIYNKNCNEYCNNYNSKSDNYHIYSNYSFILFLTDQDIYINNINMKCETGTLMIYDSKSKVKILNKQKFSLSGNVINCYNRGGTLEVLWG